MLKRIICLLLCLVLMLSLLTACGGETVAEPELSAEPESEAEVALAEVYARADERREAILNSPTEIVKSDTFVLGETYTGTAYYVSNNGSDSNDGTSPDSPFATVGPFKHISLQYGDAIFFERGSVWRAVELPWQLRSTEGLTISAYGEGHKPAFYGSEENGTGAEKWQLYYSDDRGKKIWTYYREMTEVASIVLDGDEVVIRDIAFWDGEGYQQLDDLRHDLLLGETYDPAVHLADMWCIPLIHYPDKRADEMGDALYFSWGFGGEKIFHTGPLYFRCDAGNPGELYGDIEFIMPYGFCDGMADNQCYDNLCLKYSCSTFTSGAYDGRRANGGVIQNCEFGWMGGSVFNFATSEDEGDTRIQLNAGLYGRNGGAISINGSGYTVRNNYVYDAFQEGIGLETFVGDATMQDCVVAGNLIERSSQGIVLCNWDMQVNPEHIFRNILVENNIVLDSGINNYFSTDWEAEDCSAVFLQGGPCANENVFVGNNAFAVSTGALININVHSEEYSKVFRDNVYIQSPGEIQPSPATGIGNPKGIIMNHGSFENITSDNIFKFLGDEAGKAYILE